MKATYILTLALGLGLTTACKDKFLELNPVSDAGANTFYKTASDLSNVRKSSFGTSGNRMLFIKVRLCRRTGNSLEIG